MEDKNLKEEFIKYFGIDKWNQEEILGTLQQVVFHVCENWLNIESVPILFGEHIGNDEARLDIKEKVIWLNPKNQSSWVSLIDSTLHELEHLYQLYYVSNYDTPKALRWKNELKNYIGEEDPLGNLIQEIELDAMAFAQIVLESDFVIKHKHVDPVVQELIDRYIKSNKMIDDN